MDGVGEWTTAICARKASGALVRLGRLQPTNRMDFFQEMRFPHSLGLLYSVFTAFLGFEVNEGEYKVMGMAPYGQPKYVEPKSGSCWNAVVRTAVSGWTCGIFPFYYHLREKRSRINLSSCLARRVNRGAVSSTDADQPVR